MASSTQWRVRITSVQIGSNTAAINRLEMRGVIGGATLCTGGTPSADSNDGSNFAAQGFDLITSSFWASANTAMPHWLQYTFASAVSIAEIAITARNQATWFAQAPSAFSVQYFDGSVWVTALDVPSVPTWVQNETKLFVLPVVSAKATPYRQIQLRKRKS